MIRREGMIPYGFMILFLSEILRLLYHVHPRLSSHSDRKRRILLLYNLFTQFPINIQKNMV